MSNEVKERLLKYLLINKPDNLARARMAFRWLSAEDMKKEHGKSGRTRAEVLADYERADREWQEMIDYVEAL